MSERAPVAKTWKMLIGGRFVRSESGRTMEPVGSRRDLAARASRKDVRDAVEAARAGHDAWSAATPYLRAQILYRLAEMMEGKRDELRSAIQARAARTRRGPSGGSRGGSTDRTRHRVTSAIPPQTEVALAIDRVVHYAGWADKFQQVVGCANPVSGPYHNFTIPEPVGVVGVIAPDEAPLLGLVSLVAPVVCSGNACLALASEANPIAACVFAEAVATSDMPAGAINILTGLREELIPHFATHRGIAGLHAAGVTPAQRQTLELGVAENFKRLRIRLEHPRWDDPAACESLAWIEPFLDLKTIWHPSAT